MSYNPPDYRSYAICREVQPVATAAAARARGLYNLYQSAHQHRQQQADDQHPLPASPSVGAAILNPCCETQYNIESNVGPLVDEPHVVEWRLGYRNQAEHPDAGDQNSGEGIATEKTFQADSILEPCRQRALPGRRGARWRGYRRGRARRADSRDQMPMWRPPS